MFKATDGPSEQLFLTWVLLCEDDAGRRRCATLIFQLVSSFSFRRRLASQFIRRCFFGGVWVHGKRELENAVWSTKLQSICGLAMRRVLRICVSSSRFNSLVVRRHATSILCSGMKITRELEGCGRQMVGSTGGTSLRLDRICHKGCTLLVHSPNRSRNVRCTYRH